MNRCNCGLVLTTPEALARHWDDVGHGPNTPPLQSTPQRTLRDEFAMAALAVVYHDDATLKDIAGTVYAIADACMAERSKGA